MAEPRPNFLSAFRSKLAAWLRVVAARLEGRDRTPDLMSPVRPPGPPAHWVERVQHAAPELLQPGPPNFQTRSPRDNPRHLPAAKLPPPPPPPASQTAGPVRTALRNLWLAVSRRTETPQRPAHEDKAAGTKAEAVANYPATSSARVAAAPHFPAVPGRKPQPTPAAFSQTQSAAPAPPQEEVREDQIVPARDRGKRIPSIRLSPGPNLTQPARPVPRRDLPADLGNLAQGPAKAVATPRFAPVPEKTCNVSPEEPPEKMEPRSRKSDSDRSGACNFPDFPVADRPACESQSLPAYPPWPSMRMSRPLTRPAYPPATAPIPEVPRAAEGEGQERWPALPPAAEAETRDDWRAWQREEQHRARLDLEHQGLLWTA